MSVKTKRFFKKLVNYSAPVFFIIAAIAFYYMLKETNVTWDMVKSSIRRIPLINLFMACIACFLGYIALSLYDFLALKYVARKVTWWKWMLAGMLGFAISNNAGSAAVSGGAIRYRLYTRWRIPGADIVKMLTFSGFTFFLGYAAVAVLGYFLVPEEAFIESESGILAFGMNGMLIICSSLLLAYYTFSIACCDKSMRIGGIKFQVPSIGMSLAQTLFGVMDAVCAGLVLYFCMIPLLPEGIMPFGMFMGIYVIAMVLGVFSQVPGGIGVFDAAFLAAVPDEYKGSVLAALVVYRIIYYLLPLIGLGGLFFVYENWLRARMKRWLEEAKQNIPHIHLPHKKHSLEK